MVSSASLVFCGILYTVPALFLVLGYNHDLRSLYYQTFLEYLPIKILNHLMSLNFLYGIVMFCIFNMEMLEKIKAFQKLVRDDDGHLKTLNVAIARFIFMLVVVLLSLFAHRFTEVFALNGIFMCSIIGLIIPGILSRTRVEAFRYKDTIWVKLLDWACVVAGLATLVGYFFTL